MIKLEQKRTWEERKIAARRKAGEHEAFLIARGAPEHCLMMTHGKTNCGSNGLRPQLADLWLLLPCCVKLQWCGETPKEGVLVFFLHLSSSEMHFDVARIKCWHKKLLSEHLNVAYSWYMYYFMKMLNECLFLWPPLFWQGERERESQSVREAGGWQTFRRTERQVGRQAGTQTYRNRQTDKLMGSLPGKYKHTHANNKVTNRWVNGWMKSWVKDCGNDGSTDGGERRQINTPNERRMEFNSRMQRHTNTLTDKQGPTLHTQVHEKCNYPIILHAVIVGQKMLLMFCDRWWCLDQKDTHFRSNSLWFSSEKDLVHCGLSTWSAENLSPAQQLVSRYSVPKCRIRKECVFALTPAALCMYEHMRLCKIHLCHHVYKQGFRACSVQDRTCLAVTRGQVWCQSKQRGVSAFPERKILAALWCPLDLVKTCSVFAQW